MVIQKKQKKRKIELEKERKEGLKTPYYLNLKHLKESLQNLNIEVETPDVEIKKDLKKVLPKGISVKWKSKKVGGGNE